MLFTDAIAHNKLFYMCQTWHPLGKTHLATSSSTLAKGYRLATGNSHRPGSDADRVPDLQASLEAARLDADDQIEMARLQVLGGLVTKDPKEVFQFWDACISFSKTYADVIFQDLGRAAQFVDGCATRPTPASRNPKAWLVVVFGLCLEGNKWSNLLRQVANQALSFVQDQRRHQLSRRMLGSLYKRKGFTPLAFLTGPRGPPCLHML